MVIEYENLEYKDIFEKSPVSLWNEDFSNLKIYLDNLLKINISDLRSYFSDHPEEVGKCVSLVKIIDVNQATLDLFEASSKKDLFAGLKIVFTTESFEVFKEEILYFSQGGLVFESESKLHTLTDKPITVLLKVSIIKGYEQNWGRVLVSIIDISEYKSQENTIRTLLEEKTNLANILYERLPCVALLQNPKTREIISANKRGIEAGAIVGKTCYSTWIKRSKPCPWCLAPKMWETKQNQHSEVEVINRIWDIYWIYIDHNLFLHYAFDITDQRKAEDKIRSSEAKYRELVDNANSIILKWDKSGKVIFINEYGERFFGYSKKELIGNHVVGTIVPKTESSGRDLEELMRNICTNPDNYAKNENENITKDRRKVWISWTNKAMMDERKNLIGVLSIGNDITERKIAEDDVKYQATLVENVTDAIISFDLNYTIKSWNKAAEKIYGWNAEEAIGQNLLKVSPSEFPDINLMEILKDLTEKGFWTGESIQYRKDGKKVNILSSYQAILDTKWNRIGSVTINKDITKRKKAEEELKKSNVRIEIINKVIRKCSVETDLNRGLNNILDLTLNLTKFNGGGIYLVDNAKGTAIIVCSNKLSKDFVDDVKVVAIDKGAYKQIFLEGKSIFADNYAEINPERAQRWGISSVASIPVFSDDKIVGALNIAQKEKYNFSDTDKEILTSICREIGSMIARIKAQEQLKESEQKYRHLFDKSPYSIVLTDLKGNILEFNNTIERIFGYEKEEFLGKNFLQYTRFTGEQISLFKERFKAFEREKEAGPIELQIFKKDRTQAWINLSSSLFELGNQKYILSMIQDITEKKVSEQKLKESEEKYRSLYEHSPVGIGIADLDGTVLAMNKKMEEITGFNISELNTVRLANTYVNTADRQTLLNILKQTGIVQNYEVILRKKDETPYFALLNVHLIELEGKRVLFTNVQDISEIKRIEQKLKESEEKYRLISENANDLITIINDKFIHEYINEKAFFNALGYTKDEILGKNSLILMHPNDQITALKVLKEGFEKGEGNAEIRLRHKNGTYYWFEHKGKNFIDFDGKMKAIIFSRDITERKKAEEMIMSEIGKLKELDQLKTEFVYRASHELKTPLNLVCSSSDLLSKYYSDLLDDRATSLITIINKGGLRLKDLVNQLFDVSRIETGKMKLKKQKESIVDILMDCVNSTTYLIKERNLNLFFNLKDDVILEVDRMWIEQVFINILTNAIKNTPPKGNISINAKSAENLLDIQIHDTGIGLNEEEINSLFKKFGKIERYGMGMEIDTEGSGLGLYISKEIVELHGGKILVESEGRNKGSTFIVRLPIT